MNCGIKLETEFVKNINEKQFKNLNRNLQKFVSFLFGTVKSEEFLFCEQLNVRGKADIRIRYKNLEKYVSIKTGSQNSVHTEKLETFTSFLKKMGVEQKIIEDLTWYHFGDSSLDGCGKKRMSAEEAKIKYKKEIERFNYYINRSDVLRSIIDRFLFQGKSRKYSADVIYYGSLDYGVWCSREELLFFFLTILAFILEHPIFLR